MVRLFFASDIHGSNICWKKFLSAPQRVKADALIMGGDITGKLIIPITKLPDGRYRYTLYNEQHVVESDQKLQEAVKKISDHGFYWFVGSQEEVGKISIDEGAVKALFEKLIVERMREWMREAEERTLRQPFKLFVSPGNDDSFAIDDVIKSSRGVVFCDDNVVELDGQHEMLTVAWVNETPWRTPRETSEERIAEMLEGLFPSVKNRQTLVCNIHAPPYESRLDLAPKLDENLGIVYRAGGVEMIHVGSKSIRAAIERYQPLLGLHGHIHESPGHVKIGKTLCLNPGSEYSEGILHGYTVDIEGAKIRDFWRMEL